MHRIVHLDLKGAPPKVDYLEQVLGSAKTWGATGVLLEWEDTFPYTNELVEIGSGANCNGEGMYSKQEVARIQDFCSDIGLEVIQLVQTIGHMEFVLKHPAYQQLRETASPAVLCPSQPDGQRLVRDMVAQALDAQPDARYFHIGADEVWHSGICDQCKRKADVHPHQLASLFLDHVRDLAIFIKERRPGITVLMWDDMLRTIPPKSLKAYKLGDYVQPVIWNYSMKECFMLEPDMWESYKQVFTKVWAGSAFKGANGSCQILSPVGRYVSNQQAWLAEMARESQDLDFVGIVLTGWSRYDHYATLCELLPVSIPCLANCLRALCGPDDTPHEHTSPELLPEEEWPGYGLAMCMHTFAMLRDRSLSLIHGDMVTTWMNPWQLENNFTNPTQVQSIVVNTEVMVRELKLLHPRLVQELHGVTGNRSAEEWLRTFYEPVLAGVERLYTQASARIALGPGVRPLVAQ